MIKLKNLLHENTISENLKYHIKNNITLNNDKNSILNEY